MADIGCFKHNQLEIVLRTLVLLMIITIIIYSQSKLFQRRYTSLPDTWYPGVTGTGESVLSTTICPDLVNVYNISEAYFDVDDWRMVVEGVLYVYSAHVDPRPADYSVIRIFGIISRREMRSSEAPYYCLVYADNDDTVHVIPAQQYGIDEHASPRFRMIELACNFSGNAWSLPRMLVSITTELCAESKHLLPVRQNYRNGFKTNFTLCLDGVLKHGTDKYSQLVEWIELNMILGAQHVFVYNFSGSSLLDPYFRYYQKKDLLTILPWNLPLPFNEDASELTHDFNIVWNYAQVVAENDCLYRNMYVTRHLVVLDFDEFIIPQEVGIWRWQDMMEHAQEGCNSSNSSSSSNNNNIDNNDYSIGSYLARNAFFPINIINQSNVDRFNLTTALHTAMYDKLKGATHRSKYIVRPERVRHLNIHYVETYYDPSYRTCVLLPSVGHLHHYREMIKNKRKRENLSALKYKTRIIERLRDVYREIK